MKGVERLVGGRGPGLRRLGQEAPDECIQFRRNVRPQISYGHGLLVDVGVHVGDMV